MARGALRADRLSRGGTDPNGRGGPGGAKHPRGGSWEPRGESTLYTDQELAKKEAAGKVGAPGDCADPEPLGRWVKETPWSSWSRSRQEADWGASNLG